MNKLLLGEGFNPWHNLALEEYLMDQRPEGVVLYLWQNENTVVIGRNQNAWQECRGELLEAEGGRLARRSSGGGAVFHDLGNLNFSFIMPSEQYDLMRQFSVIQRALESFGLKALVSGRNDLMLEAGGKFSGNAFRHTHGTSLHHGTLLVNANMEKLGRYLNPSPLKLASKGIQSVRSRVVNLQELVPELTIETLKSALQRAFREIYGDCVLCREADFAGPELEEREARYSSWEWRFGQAPAFDCALETRFDWGEISLQLRLSGGVVTSARVFTDSLEETLAERLERLLPGVPFQSEALAERLLSLGGAEGADLADYARKALQDKA